MSQHEPIQPRRVNLRGIIYRDGKLFCQRLHGQDFWCIPGGGIDFGETLEEGLRREMIEETAISPEIGRLLAVQQYYDGEKEQLEFFFAITNIDDYESIDLSAASHGELEVAECQFVDPRTTRVLPAFLQQFDYEAYLNGTEPVYLYSQLGNQ